MRRGEFNMTAEPAPECLYTNCLVLADHQRAQKEIFADVEIDSTKNAVVYENVRPKCTSIGAQHCKAAANSYCQRVRARASGCAYVRLAAAQRTIGSTRSGTLIRPSRAARMQARRHSAMHQMKRNAREPYSNM